MRLQNYKQTIRQTTHQLFHPECLTMINVFTDVSLKIKREEKLDAKR